MLGQRKGPYPKVGAKIVIGTAVIGTTVVPCSLNAQKQFYKLRRVLLTTKNINGGKTPCVGMSVYKSVPKYKLKLKLKKKSF